MKLRIVHKILVRLVTTTAYIHLMDLTAGLEHATIKDNVVFGSVTGFDEARYHAVIEACALRRDLEVFDAGDLTGD